MPTPYIYDFLKIYLRTAIFPIFPLYNILLTQTECVLCAVRIKSLNTI